MAVAVGAAQYREALYKSRAEGFSAVVVETEAERRFIFSRSVVSAAVKNPDAVMKTDPHSELIPLPWH